MQVFRDAIEKRGAPLPLTHYLAPEVEYKQGLTSEDFPALDAVTTLIDRKNFFEAVKHDRDFALVTSFLMGGVLLDARRPEDGATALHVAVLGNEKGRQTHMRMRSMPEILDPPCPNQLIIAFLIDNGADVNAHTTSGGETPLMLAAAAQNLRAVKLLLAKGAALDACDHLGRTCLFYAAQYPHVLQTLQVFVGTADSGKSLLPQLARQECLLHHVCRRPGSRFAALYLIEQLGMDVNAREGEEEEGMNSENEMMKAASTNCMDTSTMGRDGGSAALQMRDGYTPLHCAVSCGDVTLVKALLSKGASLEKQDAAGMTPLQLANIITPSTSVSVSSSSSSPSAMVADGNSDVRRGYVSPPRVRSLLTKFAKENSSARREAMLAEKSYSLFRCHSGVSDVVRMVIFALVPHLFMYFCCLVTSNFYVLLLAVVALFFSFQGLMRMDCARVGARPLSSFGWLIGFITVQSLIVGLYTTHYFYMYYDFYVEPRKAFLLWLIPSAVLVVVLVTYVVFVSDVGTVESTAGQRKGIYSSLAHARGAANAQSSTSTAAAVATLPKELMYSVDLVCMVKKPLRAQRCDHISRVVLRYDHYCAYLSTTIGAGNLRAFIAAHLSLASVLLAMYWYGRGYYHVMTEASATYKKFSMPTGVANNEQQTSPLNDEPLTNIVFSTACFRFLYMYTQVILPLMIILVLYVLWQQLRAVTRSMSVFDFEHAGDESSIYCFQLDANSYSLFDEGWKVNLSRFLLMQDDLKAQIHRVPQMNAYLKKIVEEYQRWKLAPGGCCDHNHGGGGGHDHSHGGGAMISPDDLGEDDTVEAKRRMQAAMQNAVSAAAAFIPTSASEHAPQRRQGSVEAPASSATQPAGGGAAAASSTLAQHIFQEMLRSGSADIAQSGQGGSNNGASGQTQEEWDAAVAQAKTMYAFFKRTMASSVPGAASAALSA